jgi:hypothetical protein
VLVTLAAVATCGVCAEAADAAVLDLRSGNANYRAAPGERNMFQLRREEGVLRFLDRDAEITVTGVVGRCAQPNAHEVVCIPEEGGAGGEPRIQIALGDRHDYALLEARDGPVLGRLHLSGGPGKDTVTYNGREHDPPLTLSLDGRANDGAAGDHANVLPDVENASIFDGGTPSGRNVDDRLVGNSRSNRLSACCRAAVFGGAGADKLSGRGTFHGGSGRDTIVSEGAGAFNGGPGDDRLSKGGFANGTARFDGGAGRDQIYAADPGYIDGLEEEGLTGVRAFKDRVRCGPGLDAVTGDRLDVLSRDCEQKRRVQDTE